MAMTRIRGVYEKVKGSGIWWIRYTDAKGSYHREKVGRRSDAITLYSKRQHERLMRRKMPEKFSSDITFNSLCDDAVEHCHASNTPYVAHDFDLKVAELRSVFGNRKATDINKQDIVRWLTEQAKHRRWKSSTQNRWQAAFSLIFRVGIDNEKIDRNPASGIRRKTENNSKVRFLSHEEEIRLRAVITNPRHLDALDISLNSGMRQSEQFSLRWHQVDLELKQLHLPKTKTGKPRHIPLNATAVTAFERLKVVGDGKASSPVFPNGREDGSPVQGARGWFKDAVERAGIAEYTWHCNRHTFASRLVQADVNLRTVGDLLGHRTAQMVMRYSHLAPEHQAAAVDRLVRATSTTVAPAVSIVR
jgi:site-specific recombinase XerD